MWTQLPPEKKGTPTATQFLAYVYYGQTAGWMKTPLRTEVPRPRPRCVRRGPSSPRKGHSSPLPLFGPCLLWPRSPISTTPEHLRCIFGFKDPQFCAQHTILTCHFDSQIQRFCTRVGHDRFWQGWAQIAVGAAQARARVAEPYLSLIHI